MTKNQSWVSGCLVALTGGVLLSSCATHPGARHGEAAHPHFEALDTNRDGRLSYHEFSASRMAKKSSNPKRLFDQVDTNADGYISLAEFVSFEKSKKARGY